MYGLLHILCIIIVAASSKLVTAKVQDGDIRLAHETDGRVEVFYNNTWGTVCDEGWDDTDAGVVCRELGLGDVGTAFLNAYFGPGSGPIWLSGIECGGNKSRFEDCSNDGWGVHNCGHGDDTGAKCGPPGVNETVEQGTAGAVVSWTEPSCDDLSGTANVTMRSHPPATLFVVGVTMVTYTCTDASGNNEMCKFNVTVNERSTTSIEFCPESTTVITCNDEERVFWDTPMSSSDDMFTVESSHSSGDVFRLGTTTVFYSVEGSQSGAQEVCNFRISVEKANGCPAASYVYIVIAASVIIIVVIFLLVILKIRHSKGARPPPDDQHAGDQGIQMQSVDHADDGITNIHATEMPQTYTTTVGSRKYASKIYNTEESSSSLYLEIDGSIGYETVE